MRNNEIIGSNIRSIRNRAQMKQRELANQLGMSQGNLSDIENGKYNITERMLEKAADTLQVTVNNLVKENPPTEVEIIKAINFALKEYDKDSIVDIMETEFGGWSSEAEVLNIVEPNIVKNILQRVS